MAEVNFRVIQILQNTFIRIRRSHDYQWGHMGCCNCGFLAQEISHRSKAEIHAMAMARSGDWNEQLRDYCPTSGLLMDDMISSILSAGFSRDDLMHLERLSDPEINKRVPGGVRLRFNVKEDVVTYISTWLHYLEDALAEEMPVPELDSEEWIGRLNKMQSLGVFC